MKLSASAKSQHLSAVQVLRGWRLGRALDPSPWQRCVREARQLLPQHFAPGHSCAHSSVNTFQAFQLSSVVWIAEVRPSQLLLGIEVLNLGG